MRTTMHIRGRSVMIWICKRRCMKYLGGLLVWALMVLQPIAARACIGDCNGDGTVTIDELITGR